MRLPITYGIMNLFMTSTPLAMRAHDHHFHDAAFVLQWHMIGMYGPSFFTGSVIHRFGVLKVILAGIVLVFVCIAAALADTGLLLSKSGWHAVNYGSIPFLLLALAATLWLMWRRRAAGRVAVRDETDEARLVGRD